MDGWANCSYAQHNRDRDTAPSGKSKVVERGRHTRSVYKYVHRDITSPLLAARKTVLSSVNECGGLWII